MKNFITTTLLLIFSLIGATGIFAYDVELDGIYYNLDTENNTATVTHKTEYNTYKGQIVIPRSINHSSTSYRVTTIGIQAFRDCAELTSVILPPTITTIQIRAFERCTALTSIDIPNGVTMIGQSAFAGCTALRSIYIPNSVTKLGGISDLGPSNIFEGCTALTEVYLSNSLSTIPSGMFKDCTSLTHIEIPNSVTRLGKRIFEGCIALTSVTLPNAIAETGRATFRNCTALETIELPNSIKTISSNTFQGCTALTHIDIPNFVTTIDGYAFYGCTALTHIILPNSIKTIGDQAFSHCELKPLCITNECTLRSGALSLLSLNSTIIAPPEMVSDIKSHFQGSVKSSPYFVDVHESYLQGIKFSIADYSNLFTTSGSFEFIKTTFNGKDLLPDKDGIYSTERLIPDTAYACVTYFKRNGTECIDTTYLSTRSPKVSISKENCSWTQSTITINEIYADSDETVVTFEKGVQINGIDYQADGNVPLKITGLDPLTSYNIIPYAIYGGNRSNGEGIIIKTLKLSLSIENPTIGSTTFSCDGSYEIGDAIIEDDGKFESYPADNSSLRTTHAGNHLQLTGLTPGSTYKVKYFVVSPSGKRSASPAYTFTTLPLELETTAPKVVSSTATVACAQTNIADEETGVGFEWQKGDASNTEAIHTCNAFLYNGTMEGRIEGLSPDSRYQVRAYYESATGNRFYGEWQDFNSGNFSHFEPTVHTYDNVSIQENSAILNGYVMGGSDKVQEQGFEYWIISDQPNYTPVPKTIQSPGNRLTATVDHLTYGATYGFRTYAKTDKNNVYGEERMFTIPSMTGIEQIEPDETPSASISIRNLSARHRLEICVNGEHGIQGRISLFNINGQRIATVETVYDGHWLSIPTTGLPTGIYLLKAEGVPHPVKLFLK